MNDNETDGAHMARALLVAIDEATRARPMQSGQVIASLGAVAAFVYMHHMAQEGTGGDVLGEVLLGTAFRDGLAALRAG